MIVRNPSGFPITPDGGDLIYKTDQSTLSANNLLGTTAVLTDIGSFYDPITGTATNTYTAVTTGNTDDSIYVNLTSANSSIAAGQLVTYTASGYLTGANAGSGLIGNTTVVAKSVDGLTLTLSKAASIPDGTTLTFSSTFLTPGKSYYYSAFVLTNEYWQRVGTALGTSIKDYNTANVIYNALPSVYVKSSTTANKNIDLYNLLRVIGVQYDLIKTKVDNAKNRYDVANLDGKLLPAMMDQMGFTYESGLGIQQSRRLLSNAEYIYLNKGTSQGIKQFVTSFTGYPTTVSSFKNLFLTLNCSSFESSTGFWGASGNALTVTNTTAALEGGSPAPYSETSSPTGYANKQLGYLKATVTSVAAASTWEISYGMSLDDFTISTTTSNNAVVGYGYITLTTTAEHGFSTGQSVVIQGMTPNYINDIWTVIAVPNAKSFTIYSSAAATAGAISVAPASSTGTVNLYDPRLYGIPVTAGSSYLPSIYAYTPAVRNIRIGVRWYDIRGTRLTAATTSSADITGDTPGAWKRINGTGFTAPSGAVYAVPYVQVLSPSNGEVYYFDAAQFELAASSPSTYSDARRVDLYLSAPRINQVINPGFELATTGWSTTGTSTFATDASNVYPTSSVGLGTAISTKSAKLTSNNAATTLSPSTDISVTSGSPYSFSAYIKGPIADTVSLNITWKATGGSTISTSTSSATTLATTFSRVSLIASAPATAVTATLTFTFAGTSGDIYYIDSVLFEIGSFVNAYFDGSTGYNETYDLVWEQNAAGTAGTASTGRSLYYPNRLLTQARLNAVIEDYLPIGTTYAVFIGTTAT